MASAHEAVDTSDTAAPSTVRLPVTGGSALRTLLGGRRSAKRYTNGSVSLSAVADLLSVVCGPSADGHRAQPAALAEYRLEVVVAVGAVTGLDPGAYRYDARAHRLERIAADPRADIAAASLDAGWLAEVPAALLLGADPAAADRRFAEQAQDQGTRFVCMELGALAQTVYLWAAARGLGTALIAGLDRERSARVAATLFPPGHDLLGVMPVGHPAETA